ncbi:unnamed protein product [Tenebrio molitor]|nr:unnamed protein product [Tenebrio molitor]
MSERDRDRFPRRNLTARSIGADSLLQISPPPLIEILHTPVVPTSVKIFTFPRGGNSNSNCVCICYGNNFPD